jgi:hypothetical protein
VSRSLKQSVAQIADALDRLVTLAEDWSSAMGLPHVNPTFAEQEEEEGR